jgi:hypothetical protein
MTTMTMPVTVERTQPDHARPVSQLIPMVVAMALLVAVALVSVLISGPMH